jgi:hypothetical protein
MDFHSHGRGRHCLGLICTPRPPRWKTSARSTGGYSAAPWVLVALVCLCGCSRGPARIAAPEWDPSEQASAALEALDADSDGKLQEEELAKAPGLAAGAKHIDNDGDGAVSADELRTRFEMFETAGVALRTPSFVVKYRGRPLAEADVKFIPEPFLKDVVEPAHGKSDADGSVLPTGPIAGVVGMRPGYYRVEVSSPKVNLPAKFNSATTLGVEVPLPTDDWAPYGAEVLQLAD